MRLIPAVLLIALMGAATLAAALPELPRDLSGQKLQGHAPNGKKDVALTINSQTVDMRGDLSWSAFAPGDCSFRTMSTATKAGMKRTIKGAAWTAPRNVNPATPFVNFSGCTSGELQRQ